MSAVPVQNNGSWVEYESLKSQWVANNPNATPEQYEQAIKRIAQQCGV